MKRKLLAALMLLTALPATALDIDITNHPEKDFILGYRHSYPGCDVAWWASKWNTEHIMGVGDCDDLREDKVMADLNSLLIAVKKLHPEFNNFAEYFRWRDGLSKKVNGEDAAKTTSPHASAIDFCVYINGRTYLFSNAPSQNHEGWKTVYLKKPEHGVIEEVATWKSFGDNAVADVRGERYMIWDFNKEDCATSALH